MNGSSRQEPTLLRPDQGLVGEKSCLTPASPCPLPPAPAMLLQHPSNSGHPRARRGSLVPWLPVSSLALGRSTLALATGFPTDLWVVTQPGGATEAGACASYPGKDGSHRADGQDQEQSLPHHEGHVVSQQPATDQGEWREWVRGQERKGEARAGASLHSGALGHVCPCAEGQSGPGELPAECRAGDT